MQGLYSLLREDNVKKELPLTYRSNLVDLVVSSQRKDLLFMVCACNAVRNVLAGSLLSTAFLKSLNFAKKEDIIVLIEVSCKWDHAHVVRHILYWHTLDSVTCFVFCVLLYNQYFLFLVLNDTLHLNKLKHMFLS